MTKIATATKSLKYAMVNEDGVLHRVNRKCRELPARPWDEVHYMSEYTAMQAISEGHDDNLVGVFRICGCVMKK